MRTWIIAATLCAAGEARADPCDLVSHEIAQRAVAALAHHPSVVEYCGSCGDAAPGIPWVPDSVRERASAQAGGAEPGPDSRYLAIDGRAVDLARIYVQTSPHRYDNLARLAGCDAYDVAPGLRVDEAARGGVLIVADATPVAVVAPAEAVAPPPAPVAPPVVVLTFTTSSGVGWGAIALGCGATSALWLLGLVGLGRRRRPMRPRASELGDRGEPRSR
jgi:hypothetical protein